MMLIPYTLINTDSGRTTYRGRINTNGNLPLAVGYRAYCEACSVLGVEPEPIESLMIVAGHR